jgi:ParB family chromosome partitioning protein
MYPRKFGIEIRDFENIDYRKEAILTEYIKISELKPHPRNKEFFDDITGEKWEEFKESIRSIGVVEPVVITPDKTIVSGHQRVRACKELGIDEVLCDMRSYDSEDQVLQALIETNIRQRGDIGGSAKKVGRRIVELERIYEIEHGNNQYGRIENNSRSSISQKELAEKLGMSEWTLRNYKKLLDMIPELEDLVDTGIVSTTTALAIVKELSPEDQKDFIESLPEVEKITEKKARELMAEYKDERDSSENNEELKQKLRDAEKELRMTEEERREFKKRYTEAAEEVKRLKDTVGNSKTLQSATLEIQLLTAATNEYIRRHAGKVWVFNEFDQLDSSVKEDFIKAIKALDGFAQQLIINLGGNITA